jgi:predicted ATPase/class 3 adenylate cyclase
MTALPSGTVTFLFTDVEGSTRLLEELGAERYAEVLARHRSVVRAAVAEHDGVEIDTQGDAFFVAFGRAADAVAAAAAAQEKLVGVRVRMGIHTGEPVLSDGGYVGIDVHRAARIAAVGHGGQVLVSQTTRDLASGVSMRDLGEHRLKDLMRPERIWQLGDAEFPPLRSLHRSRLPVAASPLVGRRPELAAIEAAVHEGVRLLTITGPGGSGKTRLALQAAAELSETFEGGTFFVALAPIRSAERLHATVAAALELPPDADVVERLGTARSLVVLDNAEHLPGAGEEIAKLRVGESVLVVTSRAPLHLVGERELPLDPLPENAAAELFVARVADHGRAVEPDETVRAICRRLDNLPLALELAAARVKVLAPAGLLQRLEHALPLLEGGPGDAPVRQQTLRAAIAWSHDLLDDNERAAFRRLSVFRGTFAVEVAEAVSGAELGTIESLVDQSLLKPIGESRLLMLETLREYAREQLDAAAETDDYTLRHAAHYAEHLREIEPILRGPRTAEFLAWFVEEEDNLRAMLDRLVERNLQAAATAASLLAPFWAALGRFREGRARLEAFAWSPGLGSAERAETLRALADMCGRLGDLDSADEAAREAGDVAATVADAALVARALNERSWVAHLRGDEDAATAFAEEAWTAARASGDARLAAACGGQYGTRLVHLGRLDEGERLIMESVEALRSHGDVASEAVELSNLANLAFIRGDYALARDRYERCQTLFRDLDHRAALATCLLGLGGSTLGCGDHVAALRALAEALDLGSASGALLESVAAAGSIGLASAHVDPPRAARLIEAARSQRSRHGILMAPADEQFERERVDVLEQVIGADSYAREARAGRELSLDETIELARSLVEVALD